MNSPHRDDEEKDIVADDLDRGDDSDKFDPDEEDESDALDCVYDDDEDDDNERASQAEGRNELMSFAQWARADEEYRVALAELRKVEDAAFLKKTTKPVTKVDVIEVIKSISLPNVGSRKPAPSLSEAWADATPVERREFCRKHQLHALYPDVAFGLLKNGAN